MTREQIGQKMAELRKLAGLTTEELALRAGVNKSTVNQMEKGKQNVSLDTLIRLSDVIQAEIVIQTRAGE